MSVYAVVRFFMDTPPDTKHLRVYNENDQYPVGEPMMGWEGVEILFLHNRKSVTVSRFRGVVVKAKHFSGGDYLKHDYRYITSGGIGLDDEYKPFLVDFVGCNWIVEIAAYGEVLKEGEPQRLCFAVLTADDL